MMDAFSDPAIEEVVIMSSSQVGKTSILENVIGFHIDHDPAPIMVVVPTLDAGGTFGKIRLGPMIRDTPCLTRKVADSKSRDSKSTILQRTFYGGHIIITGANSAASLRGRSIRIVLCDDVDEKSFLRNPEGDPIEQAKKRATTFWNRKYGLFSTPGNKGESKIEKRYEESDRRKYFVPCPHCGEFQLLKWGGVGADFGFKFERNEYKIPIDAWYECAHCHGKITDQGKVKMIAGGEWRKEAPNVKDIAGFWINELYSPWVPFLKIAAKFCESKGNREKLKTFTNTSLGESFEEDGDKPDWVRLRTRCEPYKILTIPMGGLILTAGVDVQDNRLAVVIRAWGRAEESWLICWTEIYGDPGQPQVWTDLDNLLSLPFSHASGQELHIVSTAVDSGGHHAQDVYNFVRRRSPRCIAIKGASSTGKPIISHPTSVDITWRGEKIPNGVQLWTVGTDVAKGVIYSRLKITAPGPGFYHFPIGVEEQYFIQLTAEKHVTRYVKGFPRMEWVMAGPRNEALDCEVYCYAAAARAGISHFDWDRLEKAVTGPVKAASGVVPIQNKRRVVSRGVE